jgi:hypothetical protein
LSVVHESECEPAVVGGYVVSATKSREAAIATGEHVAAARVDCGVQLLQERVGADPDGRSLAAAVSYRTPHPQR